MTKHRTPIGELTTNQAQPCSSSFDSHFTKKKYTEFDLRQAKDEAVASKNNLLDDISTQRINVSSATHHVIQCRIELELCEDNLKKEVSQLDEMKERLRQELRK